MTLKPRMIAWKQDAPTHLVDVDDNNNPINGKTLCGIKLPWGVTWEGFDVNCKRCLMIKEVTNDNNQT